MTIWDNKGIGVIHPLVCDIQHTLGNVMWQSFPQPRFLADTAD